VKRERSWNSDKVFLIFGAIVVAIALRLYLLKFPGYSFDIGTFLSWADSVSQIGIVKIYSGAVAIDYPPLIPLISSWWMNLIGSLNLNNVYGFKLLPTLAELILTVMAVFFALRSNTKYKYLFVAFVIVQPATAFVTSAWGQVDAIMTLLVVLAFLVIPKNQYASSLILALAILVKPQAAIAVFVYLLWILFKRGVLEFFVQLLVGTGFIALIGFIFMQKGGNFLPILWGSASRYPYVSMNAFNFWWMLYGPQSFSLGDGGGLISAKVQGFAMFAAFLAPAIYYLKNKAKDMAGLFLATSYFYLVFFTFLTQMHERYLYPAVALLPFAVLSHKRAPAIYFVLSITLLVNCFVVLEVAFPQFSYNFLDKINILGNWTRAVGVVNVIVAIYLALYFSVANLAGKNK